MLDIGILIEQVDRVGALFESADFRRRIARSVGSDEACVLARLLEITRRYDAKIAFLVERERSAPPAGAEGTSTRAAAARSPFEELLLDAYPDDSYADAVYVEDTYADGEPFAAVEQAAGRSRGA